MKSSCILPNYLLYFGFDQSTSGKMMKYFTLPFSEWKYRDIAHPHQPGGVNIDKTGCILP